LCVCIKNRAQNKLKIDERRINNYLIGTENEPIKSLLMIGRKNSFFVVICRIFYILYSTLLHLPPLRFHCVGGCWALKGYTNEIENFYGAGIRVTAIEMLKVKFCV
jgi:hypothetical protein